MIARTRAIRNIEISRSRMVYVCHSAPAFCLEIQKERIEKMNIKYDKKNICLHNINIATLEMLNKSFVENLVSLIFPLAGLLVKGG